MSIILDQAMNTTMIDHFSDIHSKNQIVNCNFDYILRNLKIKLKYD